MRVARNSKQAVADDHVFNGDPADVRKLILLGLAGLFVTFGMMAGAVHLLTRPTGGDAMASDDDMPSARGLGIALASGGRIDARKYDDAMNKMCQAMGEMNGDSIMTSNCKKSMRGGWW